MFLLDGLLVDSLKFVLDKVLTAAEAEANDDGPLREALLEAQLQLEMGEIDEPTFVAIERDLLARIRDIRGSGAVGVVSSGVTVEATVDADVEEHR